MNDPNSFLTKVSGLEVTLHGDPSLQFSNNDKSDYAAIKAPRISFEPEEISTDLDSFKVKVVVSNLGMAKNESFTAKLTRVLPSGNEEYQKQVSNLWYEDTIEFKIPINGFSDIGFNAFAFQTDAFNNIQETSEFNNNIEYDAQNPIGVYIRSNDLVPIYPYDFAVIPNPQVTLKASTSDPLSVSREYIIQIDSSDNYNSTLKKETIVSSSGGVVTWEPGLTYWPDSAVYFWRCSPYSANPDSLKWREFSFQYIPSERGWAQDNFRQFKDNSHSKINYDSSTRDWTYDTTNSAISATTTGYAPGASIQVFNKVVLRINQITEQENVCNGNVTPQLFISVISPNTLRPWGTAAILSNGDTLNPENDFGNDNNLDESNNANCYLGQVEAAFSFLSENQESMDSLNLMLNSKIPNDHYIMIYTGGNVRFQSNSFLSQFKSTMAGMGSSINSFNDSVPWIFFQKMGDFNSKKEAFGLVTDTTISINANMENNSDYGKYSTQLIGPAAQWEELKWNFDPNGNINADSITISILDVNNVILSQHSGIQGNVNLSGVIDAALYPLLKINVELEDQNDYTCAQTDRLHILFKPVPEVALNAAREYYFYSDTLVQGDNIKFNVAVENISEFNIDSININYVLRDASNNVINIPYQKIKPLNAGEFISDTISYSTANLFGFYNLSVEANPKNIDWKTEQYHFNNLLSKSVFVQKDRSNPILDVTFDGIHILDGDLVSAEPGIVIQLKDENPFLVLNEDADTANFEIYLFDPNGVQKRIYFTGSDGTEILTYEKATDPSNNKFKIFYNPSLDVDGTYKLSVQGRDKAGNKSGDFAYEINFEVVNESTITSILNYPNPFTSSTQFVFTLTGSELPEFFMIQIMTVTGKVVKEITQDDIGNLRIGRNITDYAWDGRDNFGDPLGNGIYLYRVITKINDENLEHRKTSADSYFKKGFGKMYLMR
jgi:hypothetical protein